MRTALQPMFCLSLAMAAALCLAVPAQAATQAGISAAVRGDVQRQAEAAPAAARVRSGDAVFMRDTLKSQSESGMQLMLLDETVFTLGSDSSLLIDEFVYDPDSGTGKVSAQIARGVFRFVSGKVAQNRATDMQVKLPVATIGVRGTMVIGSYDGVRGFVGLVGPGPDRNSRDREGAVVVSNDAGSTTLTRPGWGVFIEGFDIPPSEPFPIPPALMAEYNNALTGTGEAESYAERDASDIETAGTEAGQSQASGLASLQTVGSSQTVAGESDEEAIRQIVALGGAGLTDGIATLADLRGVPGGQFHYFHQGDLSDEGFYDFVLDIDFDSRTVGSSSSEVFFSSSFFGADSITLDAQSFASGDGQASFSWSNTLFPSGCSGGCSVIVFTDILNLGGTAAAQASHEVIITDGIETVTGSGVADQFPGQAMGGV